MSRKLRPQRRGNNKQLSQTIDHDTRRLHISSHGETIRIGHSELDHIVMRTQIATLAQQTNKTQAAIARSLHCNKNTVSKWKDADLTEPLNLLDKPRSGRPPHVTNAHRKQILSSCHDEKWTARAYVQEHKMDEPPISKSQVNRITKNANRYPYRDEVVGHLTEQHKANRLQWCLEHKDVTPQQWQNHLITDSKIFRLGGGLNKQQTRTYCVKGDYRSIRRYQKKKYGPTIHVYGGVSMLGLTKLVHIKGIITTHRYTTEVLPRLVIQTLRRRRRNGPIDQIMLFEDPNEVIFEQDFAAIHWGEEALHFLEQKGIDVIDSNTPCKMADLWPIERLWGILNNIVYVQPEPETVSELERRLFIAWKAIKPETCRALVHGIPSRIRKIIELDGEMITRKLEDEEECHCAGCAAWREFTRDNPIYRNVL